MPFLVPFLENYPFTVYIFSVCMLRFQHSPAIINAMFFCTLAAHFAKGGVRNVHRPPISARSDKSVGVFGRRRRREILTWTRECEWGVQRWRISAQTQLNQLNRMK